MPSLNTFCACRLAHRGLFSFPVSWGCESIIIVCWNYLYLSQELATEKNEKRRAELIEAIRNGSVATWKHFNLYGEFDFSDERMVDSMGLAVPKNPD